MALRPRLLAAPLLLWLVSPGMGVRAQSVSDPVAAVLAAVPTPPIAFVGIPPCRLADTRGNGFSGAFGPPAMVAQTPRVFPVAGHCGIPASAQAVSANMAVTNTTGLGFISVWPEGAPQPVPLVASMNYSAGQTIANAVLAPLGTNGGITVYARVGLDLIIDVNGYFATGVTHAAAPSSRQFQPVRRLRQRDRDGRRDGADLAEERELLREHDLFGGKPSGRSAGERAVRLD